MKGGRGIFKILRQDVLSKLRHTSHTLPKTNFDDGCEAQARLAPGWHQAGQSRCNMPLPSIGHHKNDRNKLQEKASCRSNNSSRPTVRPADEGKMLQASAELPPSGHLIACSAIGRALLKYSQPTNIMMHPTLLSCGCGIAGPVA